MQHVACSYWRTINWMGNSYGLVRLGDSSPDANGLDIVFELASRVRADRKSHALGAPSNLD